MSVARTQLGVSGEYNVTTKHGKINGRYVATTGQWFSTCKQQKEIGYDHTLYIDGVGQEDIESLVLIKERVVYD